MVSYFNTKSYIITYSGIPQKKWSATEERDELSSIYIPNLYVVLFYCDKVAIQLTPR